MTSHAEVTLWDQRVGEVRLEEPGGTAVLPYDEAFASRGPEIAPLTLPLASGGGSFPDLDRDAFKGLPGLLADALPDRFGQALIEIWLALQGRDPAAFDAVQRLAFVGRRAIGALEFAPVLASDLEGAGGRRDRRRRPVDVRLPGGPRRGRRGARAG